MERIPHGCTLASLVVLIILVLFPMKSDSTDENYKPQRQANEKAISKRFHELHDSFVSLMGRRSAAPPRSSIDDILADLLRQRTRVVHHSAKRCLQKGYLSTKESRGSNAVCNEEVTQPPLSSSVM